MPQFDLYSFSGQVFWSLIGFFLIYFFLLRFYLSPFSEMFKFREKLLTSLNFLSKNIETLYPRITFFFINKKV